MDSRCFLPLTSVLNGKVCQCKWKNVSTYVWLTDNIYPHNLVLALDINLFLSYFWASCKCILVSSQLEIVWPLLTFALMAIIVVCEVKMYYVKSKCHSHQFKMRSGCARRSKRSRHFRKRGMSFETLLVVDDGLVLWNSIKHSIIIISRIWQKEVAKIVFNHVRIFE